MQIIIRHVPPLSRPNKLSPMYGDALPVTSPIKRHYGLTSPHKSPKPTSRQPLGVGGVPHIKPYSKNRDNILLPHLKDAGEFVICHCQPICVHVQGVQICRLLWIGTGDYTIFPKLAYFFCTCHNFSPPFFCANDYYTSLLLIVCALR